MGKKEKKPLFKRWTVWVAILIVLIAIGSSSSQNNTTNTATQESQQEKTATKEESAEETKESEKEETEESAEETKKLSLQDTYNKLTTGMSKEEVEGIIGKNIGTCSVTEAEYIGKIESCYYGSAIKNVFDGGAIMVTYDNDSLSSKTITTIDVRQ